MILKLANLVFYIFLRILIFPITLFIPKTSKHIIIIGYKGAYVGNSRYLHEHFLNEKNIESFFITDSKTIRNKHNNKNVLYLFNFKTMYKILRSRVIVVDSTHHRLIGILSYRSKVVQLWHGNGMKEIGLLMFKENIFINKLRLFFTSLQGSLLKYEIVYFTSEYAADNRKEAFLYKKIKINGQPRNDVLFLPRTNHDKNILYVPTWRESKTSSLEFLNLNKINEFCMKNNINFWLKLHPMEKTNIDDKFPNIKILDKNIDVYNELKNVDLMITDYSSIYFDFLLLDKPLIFFPFDKEDYIKSRNIVYNYNDITPGPKVYDMNQLLSEMNEVIVLKQDKYLENRNEIRDLFYKYQDNKSCERVTKDILDILN